MNSLCVFCGSSLGNDPLYRQAAFSLGAMSAGKDIRLVYGGATVLLSVLFPGIYMICALPMIR